jgi:AraC family transcriptional regulator
MSRIMMQLGDSALPLSLGARGSEAAPLLSSASTPWCGPPIEVHRLRTVEDVGESGPLNGEIGLMLVTRGSYDTTLRGPRGDVTYRASRGSIHFLSGDERPHVLALKGSAEVMAMHLNPLWLEHLPFDPATIRSAAPLAGGKTLHALATAIVEEVTSGCESGRLYAESLSLAMLSYGCKLLPSCTEVHIGAKLSVAEQQRLVSYIHDNLDKSIGIGALATHLGMTPRQLTARFKNSFGTTPHRYVTTARLRQGARLLTTGRHEIADIALRIGFSSQSHFTTAFRRAFGETPSRYASGKRTISTPRHRRQRGA